MTDNENKFLGPLTPARSGAPIKGHYEEEVKDIAHILYRVKGLSIRKIAKRLGIPNETVSHWKRTLGWKTEERGIDKPKVQELTRALYIEKMAEAGMPLEKAVELQVEGMTQPRVVVPNPIASLPAQEGEEPPQPYIEEPDYNTRHKYQKDYWVMVGLHGNGQKSMEVSAGAGGVVNIQVNIPEKTKEVLTEGDYSD